MIFIAVSGARKVKSGKDLHNFLDSQSATEPMERQIKQISDHFHSGGS
jgi:hypothetical protein